MLKTSKKKSHPFVWTTPNVKGDMTITPEMVHRGTWDEFVKFAKSQPHITDKTNQVLVKPAIWNGRRVADDLAEVWGVVADVDNKNPRVAWTIEEAKERLLKADITFLIVPSHSHQTEKSGGRDRFHIYVPLEYPVAPSKAKAYIEDLNEILGGMADTESSWDNQGFFLSGRHSSKIIDHTGKRYLRPLIEIAPTDEQSSELARMSVEDIYEYVIENDTLHEAVRQLTWRLAWYDEYQGRESELKELMRKAASLTSRAEEFRKRFDDDWDKAYDQAIAKRKLDDTKEFADISEYPLWTDDDFAIENIDLNPLWLCKGFIGTGPGFLGVVNGQPSSGKSALFTDILLRYSQPQGAGFDTLYDFKFVRDEIPQVLYFYLEAAEGARRRVAAMCKLNGYSTKYFAATPMPIDLFNNETPEHLIAFIDLNIRNGRLKNRPRVIVIDTTNRAAGGADENDAGQMSRIIKNLKKITDFYEAAGWMIHHDTKSGGKIRGSGALLGAADQTLSVEKLGLGDHVIGHKDDKSREGINQMIGAKFHIKGIELGIDKDGDPVEAVAVEWPGELTVHVPQDKKQGRDDAVLETLYNWLYTNQTYELSKRKLTKEGKLRDRMLEENPGIKNPSAAGRFYDMLVKSGCIVESDVRGKAKELTFHGFDTGKLDELDF